MKMTKKMFVYSSVERVFQFTWFFGCIVLGYPFWVASLSLLYETVIRIIFWLVFMLWVVLGKKRFDDYLKKD